MSDPLLDAVIRAAREEREREQAELDPELLRPLSAEAKERNLARMLSEVRPSNVVALPARRRWGVIASAIAAAAAVLIIALSFPSPRLPEYTLAISAGAAESRGTAAPSGTPIFEPSTKLEIILRPKTDAEGPIAFRAFAVRDEKWTPWSPPSTAGEHGSIKISGPASSIFPFEPGEYELVFVVGRPEALEAVTEETARASALRRWVITVAGKK